MSKQGYRKRKWGEAITRKTVKLPVNTVEKLKLLQSLFEEEYGCPMPYDEILDRLMSSLALGKLDPRIYAKYQSILNARTELDEVVKHSTKKTDDIRSHHYDEMLKDIDDERDPIAPAREDLKEEYVPIPEIQEIMPEELPENPGMNMPTHSYKFVGADGEFKAEDEYWGIRCYMEGSEEPYSAKDMFSRGYRLVRDDGMVFTSLDVKTVISPGEAPVEIKAFSLSDLDRVGEENSPSLLEDQETLPKFAPLPQEVRQTEKRFVHPDGRQYLARKGDYTPYFAKVPGRGNLGQRTLFDEGFELKDVEI